MAAPRSKIQRERDRQEITRLYLRGVSQMDIAAKLGVNQSTVSRDLKAIQKQWRESALINMDEAKQRELARIDELERTYWDAWLVSCEDAEIERIKQAGGASGDKRAEIIKEKRGQSGNPAFLAGVERCIQLRVKIIGLEAPKKQEITGKDGGPIKLYGTISPDDWDE